MVWHQDYKEFLEELVKPEDKNATPFIQGALPYPTSGSGSLGRAATTAHSCRDIHTLSQLMPNETGTPREYILIQTQGATFHFKFQHGPAPSALSRCLHGLCTGQACALNVLGSACGADARTLTPQLVWCSADYKEHHTDVSVRFVVKLTPEKMQEALATGLHAKFKLFTKISIGKATQLHAGAAARAATMG